MKRRDAVRAGLIEPERGSHEWVVRAWPDTLLVHVIEDLGKRNLRDQRDHAVRWQAERCSAARHERKRRKEDGTWNAA